MLFHILHLRVTSQWQFIFTNYFWLLYYKKRDIIFTLNHPVIHPGWYLCWHDSVIMSRANSSKQIAQLVTSFSTDCLCLGRRLRGGECDVCPGLVFPLLPQKVWILAINTVYIKQNWKQQRKKNSDMNVALFQDNN